MDGGNMFMVTPMSQRVALDAGSTYGGYITIANPSNATEDFHYKVVVSSYNVLDEQYTADFLTRSDRSQIVDWITVDNPTGTLKPNETTKVHYKINVPSTAPAGGQYAAFVVSSNIGEISTSSVSINNIFQMASILYAEVEGDIVHEGEILGVDIPGFVATTPIVASATVRNDGNVHEAAQISLEVKDHFSAGQIYPVAGESGTIEETILPGTTRHVTRDIGNILPLGIYDVVQTVSFMGNSETMHQVVVVCPVWFMALTFAVIVSVIVAIVFSVKRHRRKHIAL